MMSRKRKARRVLFVAAFLMIHSLVIAMRNEKLGMSGQSPVSAIIALGCCRDEDKNELAIKSHGKGNLEF